MDLSLSSSLPSSRERRPSKSGGPARGRENSRSQRVQHPYAPKPNTYPKRGGTGSAIKFLLNNRQSGVFIGAGGRSINALMEVAGVDCHISGIQDVYPGSRDRVVYITGDLTQVSTATTLIWEMIGRVSQANPDEPPDWNPKIPAEPVDSVAVEGKISIPKDLSGSVIGFGGETIRTIHEQSGAQISLSNSRSEPPNTNERVVSISGTVSECATATELILTILAEEGAEFVTKGTKYPAANTSYNSSTPARQEREVQPRGRSMMNDRMLITSSPTSKINLHVFDNNTPATTLSAVTTITLAVPNSRVGSILGPNGGTIKEIMTLTGANVNVSNKGEFIDGTNNRIVSISGAPVAAQTAHTLISNILAKSE